MFERLSRDLRPRFYALVQRAAHSSAPGDGSHIIAQVDYPVQRLLAI